jgi:O-antigen ligase
MTEGRKRIGSRWWWITLAMLAALLLTFTFGAWLALAATVSFFVLLFDRKQRWKVVLAGVLILVLAAILLTVGPLRPFVEDKVLGTGMGSIAWDVFTRLDTWLFAWSMWESHPLLGVGVGNFQMMQFEHDFVHSDWAPTGSSPHQTYLYILVQFGLIGLSCMLIIMLGSIRANLSLRTDPKLGLIALALAFALTTNMVGWFSDDSGFFGPHASYLVWLFIGLSEATHNLARAAHSTAA